MDLNGLMETRAKVWDQMKAIDEKASSEKRTMSGEEKQAWTKANEDLDTLDESIRTAVDLIKREKAAEEVRAQFGDKPIPNQPGAKDKKSDEQILRAMARGQHRDENGFVAHNFHAEKRTLNEGSATAGGNTVPTSFYHQLIQHMIVNSGFLLTDPFILETDSGEGLQIPKTTAHPQASWMAEGATIPTSDATFGQVTLGAFKCGFSTQITPELEQDTGVDLLGYLASIGGQALGNTAGAGYVNGNGTGQPTGFMAAATVGVTSTNTGKAGAFTADELIALFYSVIDPYARQGTWLMKRETLGTVRTLKDGNGRYLVDMASPVELADGSAAVENILGRPVVTTPEMPAVATSAKSVAFGAFKSYCVRRVAGIRVERSVDFAFGNDLVTWRFLMRTDGKQVDTTGAIKVLQSASS